MIDRVREAGAVEAVRRCPAPQVCEPDEPPCGRHDPGARGPGDRRDRPVAGDRGCPDRKRLAGGRRDQVIPPRRARDPEPGREGHLDPGRQGDGVTQPYGRGGHHRNGAATLDRQQRHVPRDLPAGKPAGVPDRVSLRGLAAHGDVAPAAALTQHIDGHVVQRLGLHLADEPLPVSLAHRAHPGRDVDRIPRRRRVQRPQPAGVRPKGRHRDLHDRRPGPGRSRFGVCGARSGPGSRRRERGQDNGDHRARERSDVCSHIPMVPHTAGAPPQRSPDRPVHERWRSPLLSSRRTQAHMRFRDSTSHEERRSAR